MVGVSLNGWRGLRLVMVGLTATVVFSTLLPDEADARRYRRHRHYHRVHYSPPLSTIIVDANSGKVLQAKDADSLRHPASLTKIMTLYMLFERLEAGKVKLDTPLEVSEHASEQAPTKLGLRPGQSIQVEDAIKGLVTKSANDAAAVIAESIAGSEDDFAKMMTRKARALGMSKTVYRNASGLPDDQQVTTARDQALLGRAIQDRFPRYYRYFATVAFHYRGRVIRNHNHLLGRVEGVDGIKTGYTRASGFNLVSSVRRGNRHIVGVVLGGRSGRARDAMMRDLIAEHIGSGAVKRTVAAITDRDGGEFKTAQAETKQAEPKSDPRAEASAMPASQPAQAAAAPADKPQPAPLTSGVVSNEPLSLIPGATDPIQPVRVKTVNVKSGKAKTAAAPQAPLPVETASIPPVQTPSKQQAKPAVLAEQPRTAAVAEAQPARTAARDGAVYGVGQGILGTLPASNHPQASAMASGDPWPRPPVAAKPADFPAPMPSASMNDAAASNSAVAVPAPVRPQIKTVARSGWFIQVGAFDDEGEARQRLDAARGQARAVLAKADPFTEPVTKGDKTLYRARFAGFEKDQAEAACRTLKRSAISCITVKN
jgi:D-alanyl-D-alanine carboxypeptidase